MKKRTKRLGGRGRDDKTERPASPIAQQLGQRIQERRIKLGLSQMQTAELASGHAGRSMSHVTIARIETGIMSARLETIAAIAGALGTTASELLKGLR